MTSSEMTSLLGIRLEDTSQLSFSAATKIQALNVAQVAATNFLHEDYLTELEHRDTITVNASALASRGYINFADGTSENTTSANPLRGSVRNVEVSYSSTNFIFAAMIPFEDVKKLENAYLEPGNANPIAYTFHNSLYITPIAGIAGVRVYYLKEPAAIASDANCTLNVSLHEIVVDLAESQLWRSDNQVNRAKSAYESAISQISVLNEMRGVNKPEGVGA